MQDWPLIGLLFLFAIVEIIAIACGGLDPLLASLGRRRRKRQHARSVHSPDAIQAALDEHVAVMTPNAGLAVALVTSQGARHWFAGHINGDLSKTPDTDTPFEIGSITKTFTASLLVAMEREGLINLDTSLDDLLPPGNKLGKQKPATVTLENLATHCSGLPRLPWGFPMWAGLYLRPSQPYVLFSRRVLMRWLHHRNVHYGQRYRYSNLGYGALGQVLADRAGSTYADVLQRFVLHPLGLNHTRVGGAFDTTRKVAQPHTALGRRTPAWNLRALNPAGGIHSTLNDMTRWLQANLDVRSPLDTRLHEPRANSAGLHRSVALGWHVDGEGDARIIWHNGATGGSRSIIAFAPARDTGIVVLSNSAISVDALGLRLLRQTNPRAESEDKLPARLQHADNPVT